MRALSAHLRFADRDAVVQSILRLGMCRGSATPVHPPRPIQWSAFVSPVREGWVSLYAQSNQLAEWLPALSETLECPGVVFEVGETDGWSVTFYRDGRFAGRYDLPTSDAEWAVLTGVADELGYLSPGHSLEYM